MIPDLAYRGDTWPSKQLGSIDAILVFSEIIVPNFLGAVWAARTSLDLLAVRCRF